MLNDRRVANFDATMTHYVSSGEIPGLVTLIAQGDDVRVSVAGVQTLELKDPMRRDSIFRVASITKLITAAAVMMLVDEGKIGLDDAIDRWTPELANRRVLKTIESDLEDTIPAKRAITLRDVLTSTFGFGSVMAMPDTYPIQKPIREGSLGGDGMPHLSKWPAPDEWMRRLGALPLMHQPGERFLYNTSSDVQGILVSRISGMPFETFLAKRIFEPLGMKDTAFHIPREKLDRFPTLYGFDGETNSFTVFDSARESELIETPAFASGSGGLLSTVDDFHAFMHMLLHRGVGPEGRMLSEQSITTMTHDRLQAEQREGAEVFFGNGSSWGFGMAVEAMRYGWVGGFGTLAYNDPKSDFTGLLLTQRTLDSPQTPAIYDDFWKLASACIDR